MAANNDITGDSISSRVYTEKGRENHDMIFQKKSSHQWLQHSKFKDVRLYNTNGWDSAGLTLDDKISMLTFEKCLCASTISSPIKNDYED